MQKVNTEFLNEKLLESTDIRDFIEHHNANLRMDSFHHFLYDLIEKSERKNAEIFSHANLSESYGYQLLNGTRQPSRDKIIQLAFGFPLGISETNILLKLAEKSQLYVKNKRDAIIIFALNNKLSLIALNELLFDEACEIIE